MAYKSFNLIVLQLIFILYFIENSYGHKYKTYYMEDYKEDGGATVILGPTSSKDSAIVIKASRESFPRAGKYKLSVKTINMMVGIVATLQEFNLRSIGSDCKDKLQIRKSGFGDHLIYSDCSEKKFPKPLILDRSFGPPFEEYFTFILEIGDNLWKLSNLEITLTSFSKCPRKSLATDYEFFCKDQRCVNKQFKCDGRQNCGDNSDEFCSDNLSDWAIVGIIFSSIIFVILIVVCCRMCRRRRRAESCHNVPTYGSQVASPANYSYPPNPYPIQPRPSQPLNQAGIQNFGHYQQPQPGVENPGYYQQPPPPPYNNGYETKSVY